MSHMGSVQSQELPLPVLGIVCAVLFAIDAVATVVIVSTVDFPADNRRASTPGSTLPVRASVVPHVVMDIGTAAMLMGAVLN
ncbi:DUF5134 domain-containing protein [Skermania sp. ID1734]|nr:DUF5134 domain-containing protein [Skermania sp. ID1734]